MTDEAAVEALTETVGHPLDRWSRLRNRIQEDAIQRFSEIEGDWLALMWALDSFRMRGLVPNKVKNAGALNRHKGNWFAEAVALLLQNQTSEVIAPKSKVEGFSQAHQIDVAWPKDARKEPIICIETKVMGAPAAPPDTPARASRNDWSNRRKEIKFAATDLKLGRRE